MDWEYTCIAMVHVLRWSINAGQPWVNGRMKVTGNEQKLMSVEYKASGIEQRRRTENQVGGKDIFCITQLFLANTETQRVMENRWRAGIDDLMGQASSD